MNYRFTKTEAGIFATVATLLGLTLYAGPTKSADIPPAPPTPMVAFDIASNDLVLQEVVLPDGRKATMRVVEMKGGEIR